MQFADEQTVLSSILSTMVDGVIVIDPSGRIQLFNSACETVFGYTQEDVLGQNVNMLMPEPYHSAHDGYLANYRNTGEAKIIGIGRKVEGRRKSGEVFPMYLSVGENRDPVSPGYVGVIHDMSEASEQADRLKALESTHRHMSRIMAASQLGTAIAHELNQPLAALTNYMEAGMTLVETRGEGSDDPLYKVMAKAADQAHKASRILARLRKFVETGEVTSGQVDLHLACGAAIALVMPSFRNQHILLSQRCPPDLPDVIASEVQLEQVLVNLIRNACEAMVDAGIDHKVLGLTGEREGDRVRLTVSDTGPGMDAHAIADAFQPLKTTKDGGLGIGLSLSRDIITSHGGQLEASRNANGGMDFTFALPAVTPA